MTVCLCCSIFKSEIQALKAKGLFNHEIKYLTSMLHLYPSRLEKILGKEISKLHGKSIVLIYGDCCPGMNDFSAKANVKCTKVLNCCELVLGKERYKKFLKEGAFFLMPEWVARWKEVFAERLKLNKSVAREMFGHFHKYFLYLDSERVPVPETLLDQISDYFELPWKVAKVDFENAILKTLQKTIKMQDNDR